MNIGKEGFVKTNNHSDACDPVPEFIIKFP